MTPLMRSGFDPISSFQQRECTLRCSYISIYSIEEGIIYRREGKGRRCCLGDRIASIPCRRMSKVLKQFCPPRSKPQKFLKSVHDKCRHFTLVGRGMLTYSFRLMLERCKGTGIWAVATELVLSESDTWSPSWRRRNT